MSTPTTSPQLADPLDLGPRVMRNRIVFAPMSVCYQGPDGSVTPRTVEHYARRAAGGTAMVITENFAVSANGRQLPRQGLVSDERFLPGLTALAGAIKREGALAVLQISHAGRYAGPWEQYERERRLAPSAVEFELTPGRRVVPDEITGDEIVEAIAAFAAATRLARAAGFDGVHVHGAQGMLPSSFQSPIMNRRTDAYGTDRNRFTKELVQAVVDAAGEDFLVGYHLFSDEMAEGGLGPDDAVRFAREIDALGLHFLIPIPTTFESLRAQRAAFPHLDPTGHNPQLVTALVAAVDTPVFANGGLADGDQAASVLAEGEVQAVALARALFADPDWARRTLAGEPVCACSCSPPTCLKTQLTGAICHAWPEAMQASGFWGMDDVTPTREERPR